MNGLFPSSWGSAIVETTSLLQQLPNGGAVVALIVVVTIFVKRQDRGDEKMDAIVRRFTEEIATSRKDYLDHLRELTGRATKPRS
jgi:hypothetical protein